MQSPNLPRSDLSEAPVTAAARLHLEAFPDGVHILVFPNRSLTRAGLIMAAGLCAVMLLVLGGVFVHLHRHHDDCEEIVIGSEQVEILRQRGRHRESLSFPRYWVQLVVEPGDLPRRSPRLWLRSHGHSEELSRDTSAATRQALAWTLTHEIGIPVAGH